MDNTILGCECLYHGSLRITKSWNLRMSECWDATILHTAWNMCIAGVGKAFRTSQATGSRRSRGPKLLKKRSSESVTILPPEPTLKACISPKISTCNDVPENLIGLNQSVFSLRNYFPIFSVSSNQCGMDRAGLR